MEAEVQKELETLKGMVLAWKKSYLGLASPEGGDEYLADDLVGEIEMHVYPFVRRLYECNYLSPSEVNEFLDFCYNQAEELRDSLRAAEVEQL